jgi:hypothetical protein
MTYSRNGYVLLGALLLLYNPSKWTNHYRFDMYKKSHNQEMRSEIKYDPCDSPNHVTVWTLFVFVRKQKAWHFFSQLTLLLSHFNTNAKLADSNAWGMWYYPTRQLIQRQEDIGIRYVLACLHFDIEWPPFSRGVWILGAFQKQSHDAARYVVIIHTWQLMNYLFIGCQDPFSCRWTWPWSPNAAYHFRLRWCNSWNSWQCSGGLRRWYSRGWII